MATEQQAGLRAEKSNDQERKKQMENKQNEFLQMKEDVTYLLKEVEYLKKVVNHGDADGGGGNDTGSGRGGVLDEMEQVHLDKRRRHEQQQRQEHPDFKPSPNRVRRTAEA